MSTTLQSPDHTDPAIVPRPSDLGQHMDVDADVLDKDQRSTSSGRDSGMAVSSRADAGEHEVEVEVWTDDDSSEESGDWVDDGDENLERGERAGDNNGLSTPDQRLPNSNWCGRVS